MVASSNVTRIFLFRIFIASYTQIIGNLTVFNWIDCTSNQKIISESDFHKCFDLDMIFTRPKKIIEGIATKPVTDGAVRSLGQYSLHILA